MFTLSLLLLLEILADGRAKQEKGRADEARLDEKDFVGHETLEWQLRR